MLTITATALGPHRLLSTGSTGQVALQGHSEAEYHMAQVLDTKFRGSPQKVHHTQCLQFVQGMIVQHLFLEVSSLLAATSVRS